MTKMSLEEQSHTYQTCVGDLLLSFNGPPSNLLSLYFGKLNSSFFNGTHDGDDARRLLRKARKHGTGNRI